MTIGAGMPNTELTAVGVTDEPLADLIRADMENDPSFRAALWQEIVDAFRTGETAFSLSMLHDYFPETDPAILERAATRTG